LIKLWIFHIKQRAMNIHCTPDMKYGIIFCVILFISLFSEPVLVIANEVGLLPSMTGDIKAKAADSADQTKKKADFKPQVFNKQNLHSFSIRRTFSSMDVLGKEAPEEFRQHDIAASFKLPWAWYAMSGWGVGTRVMTSAGVLSGSEETALFVSVIPQVVFGGRDGRFALDMGAGGAALSRHRFGEQDFGEPLQFALTASISIPLYKKLSVGYRFLHYSDGGLYGSYTTGADLHTAELSCRF
jgi:hypothetical protein